MTSGGFDRLLRPHLRGMTGYVPIMVPGGQESDGTRPDGSIVKLDGNENVYGCSPKAAEAVARLTSHHIYPDPEQRRLRDALAEYTGVDAGHVLAGAGSDELIELLLRLIAGPGDNVVTAGPTFGFFSSSARLVGAEVIDVPRGEDFSIDVDAVLAAVGPATKVVYVANPNNPTGTLAPRRDLERLLDAGPLVVVDEAYFEFCGETVTDLVPKRDNLAVLRTFSKWAGLAGLRIGYGLFPLQVVDALMSTKSPYNINAAAEAAAVASLDDVDYLMDNVAKIVDERDRLEILLLNLDFVEVIPSRANFLLCPLVDRDAVKIQQELRSQGIFIRHFDTPRVRDCVRISVGRPEDTDAVIWALRAYEDLY